MIKPKLLTMALLLFGTMAASAQSNEHLVLNFDFENTEGRNVYDSKSGVTAKLMNKATIDEMGSGHVLNLGNGTSYLDMTRLTGKIVKTLEDFTVSVYYRVDEDANISGSGNFLWCFSQASANTATSSAYTGYRLNAQRMATSKAGWDAEVGMEMGSSSAQGRWVHVLYRQTGTKGELFIDGKCVKTNTEMPVLKNIYTAVPPYNWIGRPPFSGDAYLKQTLVDNFQIYNTAISDAEVAKLAAATSAMDEEYKYGKKGDDTALRSAIAEANALLNAQSEGYAPNALSELRDVIRTATVILSTDRASQAYLDRQEKTVRNQITAVKATANFSPLLSRPESTDHGFVHPGGIFSASDIERTKKLLAEGSFPIKRAWEILCGNEYSQAGVQTWPTETINRSSSGNYMNAARGASMAFQNALRWKISGDRAHADAAVRILMAWANTTKWISGGDMSLGSGIYGYEFAQAGELMRDYAGWNREDFKKFQQWMVSVFYNYAIDFLRRRHDTWSNFQYPGNGQRPGHYWSNWGLCNALCVMSIGVLCDDVHMYNEGMSFYKYDHVGTCRDRTNYPQILNDGCNEYIGNLVPVVLKDERGPFGYLGQMQESGRDQGHSLMSVGLALDICQQGLSQGDDLYAYWNDRIAAGIEFVAAMNFGGVDAATLPWKPYNYADRWGSLGNGWWQGGPNTGGLGERRPGWDRAISYYEGLRGVKMQYSEAAAGATCPDGGGGNYGQKSGGFDDIGFSTLCNWRPSVTAEEGITPLHGDIIYKGVTYSNQTNLGGLKYTFENVPTRAIPADGSDITLIPQLPADAEDSGNWLWETGETTRQITVKADRSKLYRVTYTAANGAKSQQSFAIAVAGDGFQEELSPEITVDGVVEKVSEKTVLEGTQVTLYAGGITGWWSDYLWDNGGKSGAIVIPSLTESRTYTCQRANQGGVVSEQKFRINVVPAIQQIDGMDANETYVLAGSSVTLKLQIPAYAFGESVTWSNGSHGNTLIVNDINEDQTLTATYEGKTYTYNIYVKQQNHSYYSMLSTANGYQLVSSPAQIEQLTSTHYFVMTSDEADLLIGLDKGKQNGNMALYYQTPVNPLADLSKVFTVETNGDGFSLRNVDYDGLLLQTENNKPYNLRTNDQPYTCEWTRLLMNYKNSTWTVENGKYPGNWLGLWTPENGYVDGEEIALNKTGDDITHMQLFAISKDRFLQDYIKGSSTPCDITPLLQNPAFQNANGFGWTLTGTWGNQRYNGAAEVWHSANFDISQTITGLPDGQYTVTCQMVNGEGDNTSYLYATSGSDTQKAVVSQSCKGSDFDTQRDKMAKDAEYGKLSVTLNVTDGTLSLGVKEPSDGNTWLVFDNFTLTYNGSDVNGITTIENDKSANGKIYDISGRLIQGKPQKGIYIMNGKKIVF